MQAVAQLVASLPSFLFPYGQTLDNQVCGQYNKEVVFSGIRLGGNDGRTTCSAKGHRPASHLLDFPGT